MRQCQLLTKCLQLDCFVDCKQRQLPNNISIYLKIFGKIGAGEGIRTLDFNLGKVALYP